MSHKDVTRNPHLEDDSEVNLRIHANNKDDKSEKEEPTVIIPLVTKSVCDDSTQELSSSEVHDALVGAELDAAALGLIGASRISQVRPSSFPPPPPRTSRPTIMAEGKDQTPTRSPPPQPKALARFGETLVPEPPIAPPLDLVAELSTLSDDDALVVVRRVREAKRANIEAKKLLDEAQAMCELQCSAEQRALHAQEATAAIIRSTELMNENAGHVWDEASALLDEANAIRAGLGIPISVHFKAVIGSKGQPEDELPKPQALVGNILNRKEFSIGGRGCDITLPSIQKIRLEDNGVIAFLRVNYHGILEVYSSVPGKTIRVNDAVVERAELNVRSKISWGDDSLTFVIIDGIRRELPSIEDLQKHLQPEKPKERRSLSRKRLALAVLAGAAAVSLGVFLLAHTWSADHLHATTLQPHIVKPAEPPVTAPAVTTQIPEVNVPNVVRTPDMEFDGTEFDEQIAGVPDNSGEEPTVYDCEHPTCMPLTAANIQKIFPENSKMDAFRIRNPTKEAKEPAKEEATGCKPPFVKNLDPSHPPHAVRIDGDYGIFDLTKATSINACYFLPLEEK